MVCSRRTRLFWLVSLFMSLVLGVVYAETLDTKVAGLLKNFRESSKGYITVTNDEFNSLIDGPSRPYHVFVFGDSTQYRDSPKLQLGKRLKSVEDVTKSIFNHQKSTEAGILDNFIVVRIVLEDSKASFGRIGALGLPYFGCIPSNMEVTPRKNIELPTRFVLMPGPVDEWNSEAIATFISRETGIDVGDVSQLKGRSPFLPLIALFVLANVAVVGYKLANSSLIHYMPLYICGSLVVYWFSMSGGMYNIIRNVPFVGMDRRTGKAMLFMSGSGQMGAEGFIMGTSVVAFGMLMAHFIFLVPTMSDATERRKTCYGIMLVGWVLLSWICGTHQWKVGLRPSFYF